MRLVIYSKIDCHLCDEMKTIVRRVTGGRADVTVEEIDIAGDRALMDLYGLEIPVLTLDGRKIAKYRISESALTKILEREGETRN